jgi:hypothetical protein
MARPCWWPGKAWHEQQQCGQLEGNRASHWHSAHTRKSHHHLLLAPSLSQAAPMSTKPRGVTKSSEPPPYGSTAQSTPLAEVALVGVLGG